MSIKRWLAREGILLLGGVLCAFLVWIPLVINVLPRWVGKEPGPTRWGGEHLPEFFGSQGAGHAVASWLMALLPYLLVQAGRILAWSFLKLRRKHTPVNTPLGVEKESGDSGSLPSMAEHRSTDTK